MSGARKIPENTAAAGGLANRRKAWPQVLALILAIAAAVAVALYLFVPPEVVPASAPTTEFSAERAMEDVRVVAKEPHPMGSPEHEEVADYRLSPRAKGRVGGFGAAVMAVAVWLFWRSHADLGRNWSPSLQLREGH